MAEYEPNSLLEPLENDGIQEYSTAYVRQYTSLRRAIDASARALESRRHGAGGAEIYDLQRRAIAALEICAITVCRLTNALNDVYQPSCDPSSSERTKLEEQTNQFLDYAQRYLLLLSCCVDTNRLALRREGVSVKSSSESFWDRVALLTPREQQTFNLLVTGMPNKVIAYELGLAESTVKTYVSSIICKLRVQNRAQIIAAAGRLERFEGRSHLSEAAGRAQLDGGRLGRSPT